ncbi:MULTISPECIES: flagellar basal body rod protein FlgC [unclassified Alteromonas]|uniref:flagellar basal body rod protein FlgC n=1 Tax=unclassified Alteromonas TaxID=2614992 RepID=UPI000C3C57FC|nr:MULTISPECIES: flagellar basal body rod protein FlgC [unclassified Alteromonas]AYA63640.1 flagellar basal body rod protein FlgC [Alteromonas sp. RKMC-009]MBT80983.1 flagellar basal body rod protein FlgC [Alteromonadaceae bacterium]MDO6476519.1 flagellar basal body rod protein FlgC [Alteromonas sp. 1_MG-2023]MEC7691391.1 flagellar basal body rod protein FlgC [Pseudomonadota bacterium]
MSLFNVMSISGTGMEAESVRLNTTASNIANANSVSSSYEETYKARYPVFAAELARASDEQSKGVGVEVKGVVESDAPLQIEYAPNNPMADENGYIYKPNVNIVEEMANMMSASKGYETNVQVADTTKRIFRQVLQLGRGQ